MTQPQAFVEALPDGTLPPLIEGRFIRSNTRSAANGVAGLNSSGKVVDAAGTEVAELADLSTTQAALQTQINNDIRYHLANADGTWPPRPATTQVVMWMGNAASGVPSFDGQVTGGGGMVPDKDIWLGGGSGVSTT